MTAELIRIGIRDGAVIVEETGAESGEEEKVSNIREVASKGLEPVWSEEEITGEAIDLALPVVEPRPGLVTGTEERNEGEEIETRTGERETRK